MSFVYLGGDETTKPTYFEVVAAERLVPSLKAALVYALSVSCAVTSRGRKGGGAVGRIVHTQLAPALALQEPQDG